MGRGTSKAGKVQVMTEEDYLRSKGYPMLSGIGIDSYAGANRMRTSDKAWNRDWSKNEGRIADYYQRRGELRDEYQNLVKKGKMREPTAAEKTIQRAKGDPNKPSTQAARRMAEKMGIDWRTGKKKKKK